MAVESLNRKFCVSLGLLFIAVFTSVVSIPCQYEYEAKDIYTELEKPVSAVMRYIFFHGTEGCTFNVTELYENVTTKLHTMKDEIFISIPFVCSNMPVRNDIHFISSEDGVSQKRPSLSVLFQIVSCSVSVNELTHFQHYGRIMGIIQNNASLILDGTNCSALKDLIWLTSSLECTPDGQLLSSQNRAFFWEKCSTGRTLNTTYALELIGCSSDYYKVKPSLLQDLFPNIYVLQLRFANVTTPVQRFPWTNIHFDEQHMDDLFTIITMKKDKNFVQRVIEIRNSYVNVSDIQFSGHLDAISLTVIRNLERLTEVMFANVTGLKTLDLKRNAINEIDKNAFSMFVNLQYLYLSRNNISVLNIDVFKSLQNLTYLDLSFNNIIVLKQNHLKYLKQLRTLYLTGNKITTLPNNFLIDQLSTIAVVYLNKNPLENIPVIPVYGQNIAVMDLSFCKITSSAFLSFIDSINIGDLEFAYRKQADVRDLDYKDRYLNLQRNYITELNLDERDRKTVLSRPLNQLYNDKKNVSQNDSVTYISHNQIRMGKLVSLILTFRVSLFLNPLDCTCSIVVPRLLSNMIAEYGLSFDWMCVFPIELRFREMASLSAKECYCPVILDKCPEHCTCFERPGFVVNADNTMGRFIIDCRNINVTDLPKEMPRGKLELWFRNSSLKHITQRPYFKNTTVIDFSLNRINSFIPTAVNSLSNATHLRLDHNNLTRLPIQFFSTNIENITLGNNPFICDCHTKWMKSWLLQRSSPVYDWKSVECTYNNTQVSKMVSLDDSMYICLKNTQVNLEKHVTILAITITFAVCVLILVPLLIYCLRFTLKVLLFTYCGFHPFDNKNNPDMKYDALVLYSNSESDFIRQNVIAQLRNKGYKMIDQHSDLIIGYSLLVNVEKFLSKSRRVIFSLTSHMLTDDFFMSAWNMAYERAKTNNLGSIILLANSDILNEPNIEESLRKYLKHGRYIKKNSKLFLPSVEYVMPTRCINAEQTRNIAVHEEHAMPMLDQDIGIEQHNEHMTLYILYHNELDDVVRRDVMPFLREKYNNVIDIEDVFEPGVDIRDKMDDKLNDANHVICVVSASFIEDDVKMFYLSSVLDWSKLVNGNFLLLCTSGNVPITDLTNPLEAYLNRFVTADLDEPCLKDRLLQALQQSPF